MADLPYAAASPDKLAEIIREAEIKLAAQLTTGIAADQRAMTLAGFVAAVEGASLAATVALAHDHRWSVALIIILVGFGIAAAAALWAAQPVGWNHSGSKPSDWLDDIQGPNDSMHDCMAAMAEYYEDMIVANERCLTIGGTITRVALVAIMASLFLAGMALAIGI